MEDVKAIEAHADLEGRVLQLEAATRWVLLAVRGILAFLGLDVPQADATREDSK